MLIFDQQKPYFKNNIETLGAPMPKISYQLTWAAGKLF